MIDDIKKVTSGRVKMAPSWHRILEWRELQRTKAEQLQNALLLKAEKAYKRRTNKKLAWTTLLFVLLQTFNFSAFIITAAEGVNNGSRDIFEVHLSYDSTKTPSLTLGEITPKLGFVPVTTTANPDFCLTLADSSHKQLYKKAMQIPKNIAYDSKAGSGQAELSKVEFVVNVPVNHAVSYLDLTNTNGSLIQEKAFRQDPSANGVALGISGIAGTNSALADSLADTNDGFLDVVFIGDKYTTNQLSDFHADATKAETQMLAVEPYKTRSSQIRFHLIDNNTSLGCAHIEGAWNSNLMSCDTQTAMGFVNNAQVPFDKVAILVNESTDGGSAQLGGVFSIETHQILFDITRNVYPHEFGHNMGLDDEYTYAPTAGGSNPAYPEPAPYYRNCFPGLNPSAPLWDGLVGTNDYSKGCTSANWWRPTTKDIMDWDGDAYYDSVSLKVVNTSFDLLAGSFAATFNAPGVSSISLNDGQNITEGINIAVTYSDQTKVQRAQIWVDNHLIQSYYDPSGLNSLSFDTRPFSNQDVSLSVKAVDALGRTGNAATVAVHVLPDTTAPVVTGTTVTPLGTQLAAFTWSTDEESRSQVEYGLTTSYGSLSAVDSSYGAFSTSSHFARATGLSPSTTYHYKVMSADKAGNIGYSADGTFTTAVGPDLTGPFPLNIVATPAASSVTITWDTDELSDARIGYAVNTATTGGMGAPKIEAGGGGGGGGTTDPLTYTTVTDTNPLTLHHSVTVTGLTSSTNYEYQVQGHDTLGNLGTFIQGFGTFATSDNTPPVISGVEFEPAYSYSDTQYPPSIFWITDEIADSQVEYGLTASYGSATTLNDTPTTGYGLTRYHIVEMPTSLVEHTVYHYRAISHDGSGNVVVGDDHQFLTGPYVTAPDKSGSFPTFTSAGSTVVFTTPPSYDLAVTFAMNVTPSSMNQHTSSLNNTFVSQYDLSATSSDNNPITTDFVAQVKLSYPSVNDSDEAKYTVLYWDGSAWVATGISGISVDAANNQISFTTNHFSEFAIFQTPTVPTAGNNGNTGDQTGQNIKLASAEKELPKTGTDALALVLNLLMAITFIEIFSRLGQRKPLV